MNPFIECILNEAPRYITQAGISTLTAIALIKIIFIERLKKSIEYEYNRKIEKIKSDYSKELVELSNILKSDSDAKLFTIKALVDEKLNLVNLSMSSYGEANKIFMRNRVNHLSKLWNYMNDIRMEVPFIMGIIEALDKDQYVSVRKASPFSKRSDLGKLSRIANEAKCARIYVGEYIYGLFEIYYSVVVYIIMIVDLREDNIEEKINWYNVNGFKKIITESLSIAEITRFDNTSVNKACYLFNLYEKKFLEASDNIIKGKENSGETLKVAQDILKQIEDMQTRGILNSNIDNT